VRLHEFHPRKAYVHASDDLKQGRQALAEIHRLVQAR
jgi:hypothetical protein